MTALQIKAIQRLPKRYIADGTDVQPTGNGWVVAVNGRLGLPLISFHKTSRRWARIRFVEGKSVIK